ncbi:hypothetical protein [Desulfobacter vibrioformis]|uniref:hypothetical protein n=1 Tax=Desulfobacter vibrioformis TaxID=34031 RepID=UPI0006920C4C|nr:hypothetical protein [Desulfobacter vibrioformis]
MSESEWMPKATNTVSKVYQSFLSDVLETHLMKKDRENIPLSEKAREQILKNKTHIDRRVLRLMTISGKGGYSSDPQKRQQYSQYFNITLLEHLLSVMRGAMLLAAVDWLARNPEMDDTGLEQRLVVIAVVGFMHDIDKDLQLARDESISLDDLAERMNRYGISDFLSRFGLSLSPAQLRYLIEKAEASQAHRHLPDIPPPREFENLTRYVRLADQLDSTWVLNNPESGGLHGVIQCLQKDQGALRSDFIKAWKEIHLFDPLHPFLLDELQRYLSRLSIHLSGIPPLIEVHQDGHLFMLLPRSRYDAILHSGLNALAEGLPFNLSLDVSNRGIPCLYNGSPTFGDLENYIETLTSKKLSDLFKIKQDLKHDVENPLDELLSEIGLQPAWPSKFTGQLLPVYASFSGFDSEAMEWMYHAAILVMLLNLKVDAKPKNAVPQSCDREKKLLDVVEKAPPEWLVSIEDDASRRTLTGLWVTALANENEDIEESVWGEDKGLLKQWLEGTEDSPGFNQFFSGEGAQVIQGVKMRLKQMLSGRRVSVSDENAKGRCIFTDEPVQFSNTIKQATGLYGVKVSAFSGREGRPESVTMDSSHTNVGASSLAEHKLRARAHGLQGGRDNGVPTLISSPVTSGLFGGLALRDDKAMVAMSAYDLSRLEIKKGKVLKGMEMYQARYRIARLERMPEKLEDQINMLRLLLTACRRTGRPFHLFRGLPVLKKEFFFYDAMPRVLADLIGGNALCLEQLPEALYQLHIAGDLMETNGLGYDVLKRYAAPQTRFGAACMAWCHIRDKKEEKKEKKPDLIKELQTEYTKYLKGEKAMGEQEGALVKLGTAAAGIQKNPGARASSSDELLVFKICLDAISAAQKDSQIDSISMIYAVAGELETNLVRREKAGKRQNRQGRTLMEGCEEVAGIFVNDVWKGVFKNKYPSQKSRRVMSSIYRVAFIKAHKEIREAQNQTDKQ